MTGEPGVAQALNDLALLIKVYAQTNYSWAPAVTLSIFTAVSSIRIFAYIPQIMQAAADRNGASAISYTTWGLFFVSNVMTVIYAVVCLGDAIMAIVFLGNAAACIVIVGVTFVKRLRHHRQSLAGESRMFLGARESTSAGQWT